MGRIKAIIMAGGRGIRLGELSKTTPKPMIKIQGKPLLEHIIYFLKKDGITDFIITLCYLHERITEYFGNGDRFGVSISYSIEDSKNPLGTAGSVGKLRNELTGTFIVTSGDTIREFSVQKMLSFHKKTRALGTLSLYENSKNDPKSTITVDKNMKITSFVERPREVPEGKILSNGSLYIFEPEIFSFIPKDQPSDFGREIFPTVLAAGKTLYGYIQNGFFLDVGNPQKIKRAEEYLANQKPLI